MAEKSLAPYKVNRIRVYLSAEDEGRAQHVAMSVAAHAESSLGVKGSAVIPQIGRWDGKEEMGYIVEVNYPVGTDPYQFRAWLEILLADAGLTAFVTEEHSLTAYEVFS